jgi:hypothetical protein
MPFDWDIGARVVLCCAFAVRIWRAPTFPWLFFLVSKTAAFARLAVAKPTSFAAITEYGDGLPQGPQLCHQGLYEVGLPHPRYTLD